jgi:hypothetical protein
VGTRFRERGLLWEWPFLQNHCTDWLFVRPVYRLNTFPFIHTGFLHMLVNIICLTPLMERFEAEHGTLNTTALFLGREYCDLAERKAIGLSSSQRWQPCPRHFIYSLTWSFWDTILLFSGRGEQPGQSNPDERNLMASTAFGYFFYSARRRLKPIVPILISSTPSPSSMLDSRGLRLTAP